MCIQLSHALTVTLMQEEGRKRRARLLAMQARMLELEVELELLSQDSAEDAHILGLSPPSPALATSLPPPITTGGRTPLGAVADRSDVDAPSSSCNTAGLFSHRVVAAPFKPISSSDGTRKRQAGHESIQQVSPPKPKPLSLPES